MSKFLDDNGLIYFWGKIKTWVNSVLPTKTSELQNDSGFITTSDIPEGAAASTTTPKMDGTASVGSETAFARGDHRHPTDTSRQAVISDLATIRSGASAGATAYQKPSGGIPKTDLATAVQTSLGKADTALQSYESEFVYVFDASNLNSSGRKTITSTEPYNAINTAFLAGKHVLAKVGNFDASMGMVDVFLPLVTLQLAPYTFMLNLKTPYGSFYVGAEVYTNKVIIDFHPIS